MTDQSFRTKDVPAYHLLCEHEGCSRRVAMLGQFTRATTCRAHRPEDGFVVQRSAQFAHNGSAGT